MTRFIELPGIAGPFERAAATAGAVDLPVPIAELMDPATTRPDLLPFLAAHRHVRLWYPDWPVARQRQVIIDWPALAAMIGSRAAAAPFLAYVDAEVVHSVSYPAQKPFGRWVLGHHPIQHPPFMARFLVKTALKAHRRAFKIGRTAFGRGCLLPPSREPLRRAKAALSISKAPETAYAVTFAHRVPRTLDDGFDLDAGHVLGSHKDRFRL